MSSELPEGWVRAPLSQIAKVAMGETLLSKDLTGTGVPVFSANTDDGPWGYTAQNRKTLRRGAIVIGARGSIGFPRLPPFDAFTSTQTTIAVEPNTTVVDSGYLHAILCAADIKSLSAQQAVPMLTLGMLAPLPILLPPLDEQRRIAEVLRSMDEAISSAKSAHSKAEEVLSQSREVATGLSLEPPDWERGPLLDFFQLQRGHDLPVQDRKGGDVPVIASNGTVGFHNVSAATRPAVVTGRSGTIGKVNYFDGPCWPLNTTLYVKNFKGSCPRYVYHFLSAFPLADYATGTGVPTLNRNDVHVVEVPWPNVAEQRSIAAALDATEETVHAAEREVLALMALKSNVADDLLTGRVRVPA